MNGDHSNWTQNLYMELFPDRDHTMMSCVTTDEDCELAGVTCEDFNKIKKGGLYHLFVSAQNLHKFMKGFRERFDEATALTHWDVSGIREFLNFPEDQRSEESLNVGTYLAGALSFAAGVSFEAPPVAAVFTMLSAAVSMFSARTPKEQVTFGNASEEAMNKLLESMQLNGLEGIDAIVSAVFGHQGHHQEDIPEVMRKGETKHPAVNTFGGGIWLLDQPTDGLNAWFKTAREQLRQLLVWQMARRFKGTYTIIRTDMDEGACTNINNGWDGATGRCYDMLIWNQKESGDSHRYFGGANELNGMFQNFGMDPMWTMKNAADCWEGSGGKVGDPRPNDNMFDRNTAPPPCFFHSEVHKGSYNSNKRGLNTDKDQDFPGQSGMTFWP